MSNWFTIDRCKLPDGYDINTYDFFQGTPSLILHDGDNIDLGNRIIQVEHTTGHSPGHMCFLKKNADIYLPAILFIKISYLLIIHLPTRTLI